MDEETGPYILELVIDHAAGSAMDEDTARTEIKRLLVYYDDEVERLRKWLKYCVVVSMFMFICTAAWIWVLLGKN
jgi:hypothetical protein